MVSFLLVRNLSKLVNEPSLIWHMSFYLFNVPGAPLPASSGSTTDPQGTGAPRAARPPSYLVWSLLPRPVDLSRGTSFDFMPRYENQLHRKAPRSLALSDSKVPALHAVQVKSIQPLVRFRHLLAFFFAKRVADAAGVRLL